MPYLLGADMGTTSLKMTLSDEQGNLIRETTKPYNLETRGDWVEMDAEEYFRIFSSAFDEISAGCEIEALSIDTQCETLIVADKNGLPLRKAIVWLDNRAVDEAYEIEKEFGVKTIYEITGQTEVAAAWPACKLLWLKRNEPEVFSKIDKVFLLSDYLLFRLTSEYVTERTVQSSSLYLDIRSGIWWQAMLNYIGIDIAILPKIINTAETVGFYGRTRVVMGVMDQISGAIGAGVTGHRRISEMTGTAMVVLSPTNTIPPYNPDCKVPCHINYDGTYCLLPWIPTAGMALKWFVENFCEGFDFKKLDALAEEIPNGCCGLTFLPYQCGSIFPKYNPTASGVFAGLTLEHNRAHFYRAVLEAVAFSLKRMLDSLDPETEEIRAVGGGALSPLWCQIKADTTGKRLVTLKHKETACLGSVIIAGVGAGLFPGVETACERLIKTDTIYTPSGVDYTGAFQKFCEWENKCI